MPHLLLFRAQVLQVRRTRLNFNRHTLDHLQPIAFDADNLAWIIRDELDLVEPEIDENLCPYAVIPQISFKSQLQIGFPVSLP